MGQRKVGRRTIKISNLDKVFWPGEGYTKGDLIDYYEAIAGVMVPHVRDRMMTLERYPDGIEGEKFFSKGIPDYFPGWVKRKKVPKSGGSVTHVVCNDAATLVYLANQACITPHVSLSRISDIRRPDQLIFDLDPPEDEFEVARAAAFELRKLLEDIGLATFVKVTGSKGVHVMTPIQPRSDFKAAGAFARDVAEALVARLPDDLTIEVKKAARAGETLVDFMRNSYGQTAVAPYGVRARPGAPVAAPIAWDELEDPHLGPRSFSIKDVPSRVEQVGDPWKGWRRKARSMSAAAKRL